MPRGDFHLSGLLRQNAKPFTADVSVQNSYFTNCPVSSRKPEHDGQCKLRNHPSSSQEIIAIDISYFYSGNVMNLMCGTRMTFVINPITKRKYIDVVGNDHIKPCVKMYHMTRNIFLCLSGVMLYILSYDDPKMTPSAIQDKIFENHLTSLLGTLGSGPYNHENIEKSLKKILLFGERANGKKNTYHYDKIGDNIFLIDFLKKLKQMVKTIFGMPTSNIAGDGTYKYGSNVVSPYFKYIDENDNLSDNDSDMKENKIKTYESTDFLKSKYNIKCRLLVLANHLNLVMEMCLAPDQSGEGEAHKYLVPAYARVLMKYFDTVEECYDSINFTTDGIEVNKNVPELVKQACIENSDIDPQWLDDFDINMVWDMKHRDWALAKLLDFKDKEAKTAVRNRQILLRKFIDKGLPPDCTIKLDYQSLIEKYNEEVFGDARAMKYLCQYCENVLKLKHTQSFELRQDIKVSMPQSKEMLRWCESALKILFYDVAPEHSVYVLSKILKLNEKMDQILLQFKPKIANKIKSFIKESIDLKCVTNDGEVDVSVPFFPALTTSVTYLIKYLRMNTPSTKSIHVPTDIDNGKLFESSKMNENGFQGIEQARGAMLSFWLRFHGQVYQDINEKSKNRPLFHSKKIINIMIKEISTSILNNFLNNQDSGNLCGTGSLGVERINRMINRYGFHIGLKTFDLCYKQVHRMLFAINSLQLNKLEQNEEKWQESMTQKNWNDVKLFNQTYRIPSFVDQDCLLVELNKNVKKEISSLAKEWILRDKITFSKNPDWGEINDMKLLYWLCDHDYNWNFTQACKKKLCDRFENLFEWEYLVLKVEEWGILLEDETDDDTDNESHDDD